MTTQQPAPAPSRTHPHYNRWGRLERYYRATYRATREDLLPFLVPHQFEAESDPAKLVRAPLGYGLGLNAAYLSDIFGHIRLAPAARSWGALSEAEDPGVGPPIGGVAGDVWADATRRGQSWPNFFGRKVLEWILSSPGGLVIVDAPPLTTTGQSVAAVAGRQEVPSIADARRDGRRPYLRFLPMSCVLDLSIGDQGPRWIRVRTQVDNRTPDGHGKVEDLITTYSLRDGVTEVERKVGRRKAEITQLGRFISADGQPRIPCVLATYGEDPVLPWLGEGLLPSLADIVVDIYNTTNECRVRFRDSALSLVAYSGSQPEEVHSQLEDGSWWLDLGEEGKIERVGAGGSEVSVGMSWIEQAVTAWGLAAKRKATSAADRAQARSGVSLVAEFEIDVKPLLTEITGRLDEIESEVMRIVAQFAGDVPAADLSAIRVDRNKEFSPGDESDRIARIVTDYIGTTLPLSPTARALIARRWRQSSGLIEDDQVLPDGRTAGEVIDEETVDMVERDDVAQRRVTELLPTAPSEPPPEPLPPVV